MFVVLKVRSPNEIVRIRMNGPLHHRPQPRSSKTMSATTLVILRTVPAIAIVHKSAHFGMVQEIGGNHAFSEIIKLKI